MHKKFLFIAILFSLLGGTAGAQGAKDAIEPQFVTFWSAFRSAVVTNNNQKLLSMISFPLIEVTATGGKDTTRQLTKEQFIAHGFGVHFSADVISALKGMSKPKASRFKSLDKNCRSFTSHWQVFPPDEREEGAPPDAVKRISCNLTWLYLGDAGNTLDQQFKFALVGGRYLLYKVSRWAN